MLPTMETCGKLLNLSIKDLQTYDGNVPLQRKLALSFLSHFLSNQPFPPLTSKD